jgi:phospholipid/cholesterol/gamma-HCH transport system substrate-binding protein/paraquat-inducible protein B
MSADARYFRVGLFVLIGLLLIGGCTVMLAGEQLFAETIALETYFDESVQGLDVGSPVKLRGVKLGSVSAIGLVQDYYPFATEDERLKYGQKVLVLMELQPQEQRSGVELTRRERARNIKRMIERGLRLRLTSSGLTGTSFIEADYQTPDSHPPMEITWEPKNFYVPSTPSAMKAFTTAAERIFSRLEDVEVEKVVENLDELIVSLTTQVDQLNTGQVRGELVGLVSELRGTNMRLQQMIAGGQYDFQIALENLRVASEDLRELTDTAREYPSYIILGEPPKASKVPGR